MFWIGPGWAQDRDATPPMLCRMKTVDALAKWEANLVMFLSLVLQIPC